MVHLRGVQYSTHFVQFIGLRSQFLGFHLQVNQLIPRPHQLHWRFGGAFLDSARVKLRLTQEVVTLPSLKKRVRVGQQLVFYLADFFSEGMVVFGFSHMLRMKN